MSNPRTRIPMRRSQAGMSLVELMISMTLGLLIIVGMTQLFVQSKTSFNQDETIARMQEDARFGMNELMRDISLGGFYASLLNPASITTEATIVLNTDCGPVGFLGNYMFDFTSSLDQLDNATAAEAAAAFQCIDAAAYQATSDIVVVKKVEGGQTAAGALTAGVTYLQTNGTVGYLFQAPIPAAPTLSITGANDIWQYNPVIYYVRNYSVAAGDNTPALCRKVLTTAGGVNMTDECVAEGVQTLQIEFGVDTDNDGVANQYLFDPTAAQMSLVVSVRVFLVARSVDIDQSYTNDKTYTVSNHPVVTASDNYYRRVFSTTILVRNPTNLNKMDAT